MHYLLCVDSKLRSLKSQNVTFRKRLSRPALQTAWWPRSIDVNDALPPFGGIASGAKVRNIFVTPKLFHKKITSLSSKREQGSNDAVSDLSDEQQFAVLRQRPERVVNDQFQLVYLIADFVELGFYLVVIVDGFLMLVGNLIGQLAGVDKVFYATSATIVSGAMAERTKGSTSTSTASRAITDRATQRVRKNFVSSCLCVQLNTSG